MTPEELRKEANAAEFLARVVSYGRDREWLLTKAADLRDRAARLEAPTRAGPEAAGSEAAASRQQGGAG